MANSEVLWQPSEERVERSQMHAFMQAMGAKYGFGPGWTAMHGWSVAHRDQFWGEMLAVAGINSSKPAERVSRTGGSAAGGPVAPPRSTGGQAASGTPRGRCAPISSTRGSGPKWEFV